MLHVNRIPGSDQMLTPHTDLNSLACPTYQQVPFCLSGNLLFKESPVPIVTCEGTFQLNTDFLFTKVTGEIPRDRSKTYYYFII